MRPARTRDTARVRRPGAGSFAWLLALGLFVSSALGGAQVRGDYTGYDPEMAERIRRVEERRTAVVAPPEEPPPARSEADRMREGAAAIEDVLRGTTGARRDVDGEYREVLEAEVQALGPEAAALELDDVVVPPDQVPELPPVPFRVTNQVRSGYDDSLFLSNASSPLSTTVVYGEYRLSYEDVPAPKTNLRADGVAFVSNIRRSGLTFFDIEHNFDRKHTGLLTATAIVERWTDELSLNDNLLANGAGTYVIHFPEELDLTSRYSYERKTFDTETLDTLSSRNGILELRLEKRMHGGTARFVYLEDELDFPSDRTADLSRSTVIGGYTAPVHPKVDLDYAYIRVKEATSLDVGDIGDYTQATNRLNLFFKFSPAMQLSLDIENEDRNYIAADTTFVSYGRTVFGPTFFVNQTQRLSYSFGLFEEVYTYRELDPALEFNASLNDFHTQTYRFGVQYAKKRLLAAINYAAGPTEYKLSSDIQSDFVTRDTAINVLYDFDEVTRASASYARTSQVFETQPINNILSEQIVAEVLRRF